jgi:hypothetical protein
MFGDLSDVLYDVSVEPCYALNSKARTFGKQDLSSVGTVLFDKRRNFSLRIERNLFKFISNQDLIYKAKELTSGSKLVWKIIYYNNDKTEFYLNGIINEWKGLVDSRTTLLKPALELSNFYTGRYNSRILFSIYNPVLQVFIRTPLTLHTDETITSPLQQLHNALTQTYLPEFLSNKFVDEQASFTDISFGQTIIDHLPYRIKELITAKTRMLVDYYKSITFPVKEYQLVALTLVALLAHEWSGSNYEQARKFQHFMFERIMRYVPFFYDNKFIIKL